MRTILFFSFLLLSLLLFVCVPAYGQDLSTSGGLPGRGVSTIPGSGTDLKDELVAWYDFANTSGTRTDGQNGYPLEPGSTDPTADANGLIFDLGDATLEYLYSPPWDSYPFRLNQTAYTIAIRFIPEDIGAAANFIMAADTSGPEVAHMWELTLWSGDGGNVAFTVFEGGDTYKLQGNASNTVIQDVENTALIEYDGSTMSMEINESGAPVTLANTAGSRVIYNTFKVGGRQGTCILSCSPFDGQIKQLAFWNRQLTQSEKDFWHDDLVYADIPGSGTTTAPGTPSVSVAAGDGDVTVTITPGSNQTGSRLLWGTGTGSYSDSLDVGDFTHSTIAWSNGDDIFVVARSYSMGGLSALSAEDSGTPTSGVGADFTASTYTDARTPGNWTPTDTGCDVGETLEITTPPINGVFDCIAAATTLTRLEGVSPSTWTDDGGIALDITGDTDWWVRRLKNTDDRPDKDNLVELDWYNETGGSCSTTAPYLLQDVNTCNVSNLLDFLAGKWGDDLFVRMPSNIDTLLWGGANMQDFTVYSRTPWSVNDSLYFVEPTTTTLVLKRDSDPSQYNAGLMVLDDYNVVVLGATAERQPRTDYRLKLYETGERLGQGYPSANPHAMITAPGGPNDETRLEIRLHVIRPERWALNIGACPPWWDTACSTINTDGPDSLFIAGYYAGGIALSSRWQVADFDATVAGPYGQGGGYCAGRACSGTYTDFSYFNKHSGMSIIGTGGGTGNKVTGEVTYKWAVLGHTWVNIEYLGESRSDPFVFTFEDVGFLGPESAEIGGSECLNLDSSGFQWQYHKVDGIGDHGANKKFYSMKYSELDCPSVSTAISPAFHWEATTTSATNTNRGIYAKVEGGFKDNIYSAWVQNTGDYSYKHTFEGSGTALSQGYILLVEGDSLISGTWNSVYVAAAKLQGGGSPSTTPDPHDTVVSGATISNVMVICSSALGAGADGTCGTGAGPSAADTRFAVGSVVLDPDAGGPAQAGDIVLENVTWTKGSGTVLDIGGSSNVRACGITGVSGTDVSINGTSDFLVWDGANWADQGTNYAFNGSASTACP